MRTNNLKKHLPLLVLTVILCFLIVCPLLSIFARAVITDGRLDFASVGQTLSADENITMIGNSLLLGVLVVIVSKSSPRRWLTSFPGRALQNIGFLILSL